MVRYFPGSVIEIRVMISPHLSFPTTFQLVSLQGVVIFECSFAVILSSIAQSRQFDVEMHTEKTSKAPTPHPRGELLAPTGHVV